MTTYNSKVAPSSGKWRGRVIKKTRQSRSISLVPLIVKVPPSRLKGIKLTKPRKSPRKGKPHEEAAHSKPLPAGGESKPLPAGGESKPLPAGGEAAHSKPLQVGGESKPLQAGGESKPLQMGVGRDEIVDEPVSNSTETKNSSCDNPTLHKDAVALSLVVKKRGPKRGVRPKGDCLKSMQESEKISHGGIEETDAALFATQGTSSINSSFAEDLIANSSHLTTGDETTELHYSSLDAKYPIPSTPQQKMVRRLAREKQLEDMRVREAALAREERFQRRQGVVKPSRTQSSKHIKWKSESDLVEIFIYSPHKESLEVVPS